MEIVNKGKCHAVLDIQKAHDELTKFGPRRVGLTPVTGPLAIAAIEWYRDEYNLRIGRSIPTDVFAFGIGMPNDPRLTRIGGLPYWPLDRQIPKTPDGNPLYFLAQINFSDSLDILPNLPSTLLSIFSYTTDFEGCCADLVFEWINTDLPCDLNAQAPMAIPNMGPFYGVIHRTYDYPDAVHEAYTYRNLKGWLAVKATATKIGGIPSFRFPSSECELPPGRFLCELNSIKACAGLGMPYPFTNDSRPIEIGDARYRLAVGFGDLGYYDLFEDRDRSVDWRFWPTF